MKAQNMIMVITMTIAVHHDDGVPMTTLCHAVVSKVSISNASLTSDCLILRLCKRMY